MGGYEYEDTSETKRLLPVNGEDDVEKKKNVVVIERTATLFSSSINLTNTIIGAGVLGLPYAVASCGLTLGIVLLMLSSLAGGFGLYLLVQCSDKLTSKSVPNASYYTCAKLTYPNFAFIIDAVVLIKCFGVAVSYLIVIGDLMPDVMSFFFKLEDGDDSILLNRQLWIAVSAVLIVPLCFLKQLHSLWFSSLLSLFTVAYLLSLVVSYFFIDGLPIPADRDIDYYETSLKFFNVMTIFVFGFTCHQNIFSIYNEIQDPTPKRINTVIFTSIGTALVVYLIIAILGYLTYGNDVDENIINNYSTSSAAVTVGRIFIVVHVALAVPLQQHPARICFDNLYKIFISRFFGKEATPQTLLRFVLETLIILSGVYLLGLTFSQLKVVLGLVGATGSTTMCYILPGLFYLKMFNEEEWSATKTFCCIMVGLGIFIMPTAIVFIFLEI